VDLNDRIKQFIEKTGLMFERMGATRTAGRMMGLLLVADRPLSLAEMAELLQLSKASLSTNARLAEQSHMIQRVSIPGDRRDYYEILPDSFESMLALRIQAIDGFVGLTDEGLAAIDGINTAAHARLETMKQFYQFFKNELKVSLDRWREISGGTDK
jgi:DNA-binding transcriptional regulator GbsR (MarR family)